MTWEQIVQDELDFILNSTFPKGWDRLQRERIKTSLERIRTFGRIEATKDVINKIKGGNNEEDSINDISCFGTC